MLGLDFEPWEPEESVGKLWHKYATGLDSPAAHEDQTVKLSAIEGRLAIFFRGLGGAQDVQIKTAPHQASAHRLSWKRRLGHDTERLAAVRFDGETLWLPESINEFADIENNMALYFWLTAISVFARMPDEDRDPLRRDIRTLQSAQQMTQALLTECSGMQPVYVRLKNEILRQRKQRQLPRYEAAVEHAILRLLGGPATNDKISEKITAIALGSSNEIEHFAAPRGYQPFMPVSVWPNICLPEERKLTDRVEEQPGDVDTKADDDGIYRATRKKADSASRKDSLILHKFEAIFSWTEFLNLNRRIEDDDDDNARKAADDQEEISLTDIPQRTATKLKLHLDLSPEDAERERLAGVFVYPEWDHRSRSYLTDHCRVLETPAEPAEDLPQYLSDAGVRRRIRSVRRQFEALRPRRQILPKQIEGDELDIEAAIQARVDLFASGEHSDRVYRAARCQNRDLGVAVLLDISRSTESSVADRRVIDIAREALIALAWGLDGCGDDISIHAFSSLKRDRVFIQRCKSFGEAMSADVEARIVGLRPGFYTRLGAAVRHVSDDLSKCEHARQLLLLVTDGKPNDLDHYEGRHGIEDSHMAIREARRKGQSVFAVTVDVKSRSQFNRVFGRGGYSVVSDATKLTEALPKIYRQLVAG